MRLREQRKGRCINLGIPSPKPEARNPKPETRNSKPKLETRNPKPETRDPKPETRKQAEWGHAATVEDGDTEL